jgi:hypothetical protein
VVNSDINYLLRALHENILLIIAVGKHSSLFQWNTNKGFMTESRSNSLPNDLMTKIDLQKNCLFKFIATA